MTQGRKTEFCWLSKAIYAMSHREQAALLDRLFKGSKLDPETGCLNWQGRMSSHGHGLLTVGGRQARPYRALWILRRGGIPVDMMYRHGRDDRGNPCSAQCINIEHGRGLGSWAENNADRSVDQTHCKNGHPREGDNIRVDRMGWVVCNPCQREHVRRHRDRLLTKSA